MGSKFETPLVATRPSHSKKGPTAPYMHFETLPPLRSIFGVFAGAFMRFASAGGAIGEAPGGVAGRPTFPAGLMPFGIPPVLGAFIR